MQRLLLSVLLLVAVMAGDASAGLGTSPSLGPADAGVVDAAPPDVDAGPELRRAGVDAGGDWVFDLERFLVLAGLAWSFVSAVVAVTPTKRDDEFLRKVAERFSFLNPSNVRAAAGVFKLPLAKPRRAGGRS